MSVRFASTLAVAMLAWGMIVLPAAAQDAPPPPQGATAQSADPPTRVGRIAALDGTVSFRPAPDAEWGNAVANYPVAGQTAIWVDENSSAEIEIGAAHIRLGAGTELDVTELDDHAVALSVPQGRIEMVLNGRQPDEHYTIGTPRGAVSLIDGRYGIDSGTPDEATRIAAFAGTAQLTVADHEIDVTAGQEATSDTADPPFYSVAPAIEDDFAGAAPSDTGDRSHTPGSVPPIPGAAILSQYGSWRDVQGYGHVWMPADVDPDWTPYSAGHWAWVAPWGWTWIDDAPWGFAPFHYGRWVRIDGAWAWVPVDPQAADDGAYVPAYAPALVAFADDADSYDADLDGPCVGWIPLGIGEYWFPWFHASDWYLHRVNRHQGRGGVTVNNRPTAAQAQEFMNRHSLILTQRDTFARGDEVRNAALSIRTGATDGAVRAANLGPGGRASLPEPMPIARSNAPIKPVAVPHLPRAESDAASLSRLVRPAAVPPGIGYPRTPSTRAGIARPHPVTPNRTVTAAPATSALRFPLATQPAPAPVARTPAAPTASGPPSAAASSRMITVPHGNLGNGH